MGEQPGVDDAVHLTPGVDHFHGNELIGLVFAVEGIAGSVCPRSGPAADGHLRVRAQIGDREAFAPQLMR